MDYKRLLGMRFSDLVGLDVGSTTVKLVQFARNGENIETVSAGTAKINFEGDSTFQGRELKTVRAINECCQQTGVANKHVVCGVCGPDVAVRYFKFPVLATDEIPSAVALEAEQVCPFSMDDSVLDYQIIPDGADSVCGVLVAATNKAIRRKGKLVKDASLNPVLMDVDGLALLNCLMQCEGAATDQALAVLNVGDTYTTLVIAGERGVPFVRDTNNAGADIIKNISEQTEMSRDRIYNILFNDDISAEEQSLLERALEECCEILIDDVTGTLRFYAAQKKILPVEKIYVCGGFARAKGFVDILDRRLPANAVLWNPFDKIPCRGDKNCEQILQKEGPALAVAAGLAMRSI